MVVKYNIEKMPPISTEVALHPLADVSQAVQRGRLCLVSLRALCDSVVTQCCASGCCQERRWPFQTQGTPIETLTVGCCLSVPRKKFTPNFKNPLSPKP